MYTFNGGALESVSKTFPHPHTMRILSWDIGTKTLSYCLLEVTPTDGTPRVDIHEWESIDVRKEAGLGDKAKPTMREDCEYVIQAVSARAETLWGYALDHISIEQQPAGGRNMFSSVRMKVVSHALHAYFFAQQLGSDRRVPVTFVSPSSKLVGLDFHESEEDAAARQAGDRKTMGAKYRANKRHAVECTQRCLQEMEGELAHRARVTFAGAIGKQDDLSDAFMLGYAFCKKALEPKPKRRKVQTSTSMSSGRSATSSESVS